MEQISFLDLGEIEYGEAWEFQEKLLKENIEAKAAWYSGNAAEPYNAPTTHHLIFCAHPAVYTLGKSGKESHLLADEADRKNLDVSFYKTNRGGDITYHGPGQIVGYPILDLEKYFTDLGKYMRSLEEVIIRALETFGIQGYRLEGATGVWLDVDDPRKSRKICAMGVRCSRWITMHGFALNVNTDLSYFNHIIPCGISDKGVTSMQKELGKEIDIESVKEELVRQFGIVFQSEIIMPQVVTP